MHLLIISEKLQVDFPDIIILHSPEFLVEKTAAYNASTPDRNIIGITKETKEHRETVIALAPDNFFILVTIVSSFSPFSHN